MPDGPDYDSRVQIKVIDDRNPVLNDFIMSDASVSIIRGPLGSGKTTGVVTGRILRHMMEQPANPDGIRPSRGIVIRNTYPDLMGTTVKDFREVFDRFSTFKMGGLEPPTATVRFVMKDSTIVECEVIFLALDREDAVRKLRGYQVTWVWFSETKEIIKPVWDMADLRHGRYPSKAHKQVECGWHGMFGDTNSWDDTHWLWNLAEKPPEGWEFFHQAGGVYRDGRNPDGSVKWTVNEQAENATNLPDDYYARGMAGKSETWIAVNLGNEYGFTIDGQPVWEEYNDPVHCPPEPIPYDPELPLLLGVDFGRTPAAAIVQHNRTMGRFSVIDEFVADSMSASVFGPELRRYIGYTYPQAKVYGWGDPAGDAAGQTVETTPIQVLRAAGIPINPAPTNTMLLRRSAVIQPLMRNAIDGRPSLLISSKCKTLRKGAAGGFCYRKLNVRGEERFHETPEKNSIYSHICEALEYALLGEGEGVATLERPVFDRRPRQETADM